MNNKGRTKLAIFSLLALAAVLSLYLSINYVAAAFPNFALSFSANSTGANYNPSLNQFNFLEDVNTRINITVGNLNVTQNITQVNFTIYAPASLGGLSGLIIKLIRPANASGPSSRSDSCA